MNDIQSKLTTIPQFEEFVEKTSATVEEILDNLTKASPYFPLHHMRNQFRDSFHALRSYAAGNKVAFLPITSQEFTRLSGPMRGKLARLAALYAVTRVHDEADDFLPRFIEVGADRKITPEERARARFITDRIETVLQLGAAARVQFLKEVRANNTGALHLTDDQMFAALSGERKRFNDVCKRIIARAE